MAYPDAPDMRSWYEGYAGGQKNRLAFDLDWVRRFATGDKIVEFGAMPPILTVALARQGYPVVGLDLAPGRFQDAVCKEGLSVQAVDFETQPLPFADDSSTLRFSTKCSSISESTQSSRFVKLVAC